MRSCLRSLLDTISQQNAGHQSRLGATAAAHLDQVGSLLLGLYDAEGN